MRKRNYQIQNFYTCNISPTLFSGQGFGTPFLVWRKGSSFSRILQVVYSSFVSLPWYDIGMCLRDRLMMYPRWFVLQLWHINYTAHFYLSYFALWVLAHQYGHFSYYTIEAAVSVLYESLQEQFLN